jgi:pimeloyl-ACP methyl ester carboxylesterase
VLSALAERRQLISLEQQAHGHTADIDRPLRVKDMADDTAAALHELGITQADFFGYSMGAGIALEIGIRYPELVRKLVLASVSYNTDGFHPGLLEGISGLQPEHLVGTPWHAEYLRVAPRPEDFSQMVARVKDMDEHPVDWPAEAIASIQAPTLLVVGDSDIIRPEHAVEMFRLLGGGVAGDIAALPKSQLAILPGTTHVSLVSRADLLMPIVSAFIDPE